jgi:hypothetical protein
VWYTFRATNAWYRFPNPAGSKFPKGRKFQLAMARQHSELRPLAQSMRCITAKASSTEILRCAAGMFSPRPMSDRVDVGSGPVRRPAAVVRQAHTTQPPRNVCISDRQHLHLVWLV